MSETATPSHIYFRPTTAAQRELLFRTAEETGNVRHAASVAHVGRGTYYYWRDRVLAGGYPALAQERSRAPHTFRIPATAPAIIEEVKAVKGANPAAGYATIANLVRKAHNWQPVIGPTKVRDILIEVGLVRPLAQTRAKAAKFPACHAPEADQTFNIDLCLVPTTHETGQPLKSVTVAAAAKGEVSSQSETGSAPQEWAGQVFADKGTTYDQKMVTYVQKRATQGHREHRRRQQQTQQALLKAKEQELRCQRRHQRWARQASNQAWRDYCQVRKAQDRNWQILPRAEKQQKRAERREQNQERRERWAIRRAEVQARRQDDAAWHQARQAIRQEQAQLQQTPPPVSEWLSILAVLDNCTRVSPGLPIFAAGAHVTSETVVAGLEPLLPPELCYLISDNGTQFRAENFAALATRQSLVHVRIAPRRACTNGIAERFIQTLKKWLEEHAWHNAEELRKLLEEFLAFYNDRPHQGAALNGLSPNEYARRLAT